MIRYIIITIIGLIQAVLCSTLVVEISSYNQIHWQSIPDTVSFKLLIILYLITITLYFFDYKKIKSDQKRIRHKTIDVIIKSGVIDTIIKEAEKAIIDNDMDRFDSLATFKEKLGGFTK